METETETEKLSSYEECRRKRIEENKKRLEELNLTHLANSLSRKSNHRPVAKPSSSTPATKRGRGRPKGRPSEEKQQPKRGRGRPRKGRPSEEEEEEKQKPVPVGVRRSLRTCNLPAPDYSKTSTSMKSDVSVSVPPSLSRSEKMEVSVSVLSSYSRSKKVVVACIPPDGYSWRRGGRQLTRGSTDPRRWYYICSSVEGCPARKHVEWAVDDPSMLIVTYKSYHTHPSVSVTAPAAAAALVLEPS